MICYKSTASLACSSWGQVNAKNHVSRYLRRCRGKSAEAWNTTSATSCCRRRCAHPAVDCVRSHLPACSCNTLLVSAHVQKAPQRTFRGCLSSFSENGMTSVEHGNQSGSDVQENSPSAPLLGAAPTATAMQWGDLPWDFQRSIISLFLRCVRLLS